MRGIELIISYEPLERTLQDRHMKKSELRVKAGLSKATFAKLGKGESVTLDTVVKICEALDCRIEDVVRITPASAGNGSDGE